VKLIQGPLGPFAIPEEWPSAESSMRAIWDGEYSYPREKSEDVHTLIDVGSNIGGFIAWARTWWPSLQNIYAYEPNEKARHVAKINDVNAMPYAITTSDNPRLSGTENWGDWNVMSDRGAKVPAMHPSYLPRCDVLKLDCEGSELEIIEHYPHLASCKVVLVEIHRGVYLIPIHEKLTHLGFEMKRGNPHADDCDVRVYVRKS
jgi:FkbM family methyltransferase